jgi:hypothetical protein
MLHPALRLLIDAALHHERPVPLDPAPQTCSEWGAPMTLHDTARYALTNR